MPRVVKQFYEFGPFRLDVQKHRLFRDGEPVPVSPKAMEALIVFVQHPGQMLEREALMQAVWADNFVEDANLTVAVSQLRKALGQKGETAEYIETIPRVGYRFVADVREVREEPSSLIVEKRTLLRTVIEEEEIQPEETHLVSVAVSSTQALLPQQSRLQTRTKWALAAAAVVLVAVAVLGVSAWRGWNQATSSGTVVQSIAVLPFKVVSAETGSEHLGLGMADVLITRLSNIRELKVRPTSAVVAFDKREQDSIAAGRSLSVDAVLEGTIHRSHDRVRVTARLLRVSDQSSLWAGVFEKPAQDELEVQDEIALQVVDALALSLVGNEKSALTKRYTESADAYQLYLKGRFHWNKRSWAGMVEAERLFRNAIERDPKFALAFVGLADSLATGADPTEADSALKKALELDPFLPEAHATRGFISTFHHWKWREAEDSFKKAIELSPGYATAHHWYATLLAIQGKTDAAKAEMRLALEINPLSHNFLADMGQLYYFSREYDRAKEYCRKALEINPDFVFAHEYLSDIYLQTGEYANAIDEEIKASRIHSAFAMDSVKRQEENEAAFTKLRGMYERGGIRAYMQDRLTDSPVNYTDATIYAFLGEKQQALDSLEKAQQGRAFLSAFVKADPVFDVLRGEPRYHAILKNMGLE